VGWNTAALSFGPKKLCETVTGSPWVNSCRNAVLQCVMLFESNAVFTLCRMHYQVSLLTGAYPRGDEGDDPPSTTKCMFFPVNKRLLTGPQFTTNISTKCIIWRLKALNSFFCRGSALKPIGGAHDAPPDSLVTWGAS